MSTKEPAGKSKDKSPAKEPPQPQTQQTFETVTPQLATMIQRARVDPRTLRPGQVQQIQRSIGNRAVGQFMPHLIQRKPDIDPETVEAYKEKLGIEGQVKVVEVPNNPKIIATTPFREYPDTARYGLEDADLDQSVFTTNFTPDQQREIAKDKDFLQSPASLIIEMAGGGGYLHTHGIIILNAGQGDRTLLHEMGHMEQHEKGFHGGNATVVVLEYHNFIKNENQYGGDVRTYYNADLIRKDPKKSWEELKADVGSDGATASMLEEIEAMLGTDQYETTQEQIKQNLIREYFNTKLGG